MKELSIEEKAKRYDEAITKGKQIQNTPYTAHWDIMKEVAEHLLPELNESEDDRIRDEIISAIEEDWPGHTDWIAWLEKQGEQKPEVWSEEDENHINSLLKRLEGLCRNEFATTRFAINEDEDWLKSLRPQNTWKPSDEQMEALKGVQEGVFRLGILESLYQDLKKLREE